MVKVGDRIRLSSGKGPDREGVVTAIRGSMVRVRWPSAGETTVIPAPGTLTVLASSGAQARPAARPERAVRTKAVAKKAVAKKAAPKKAAGKTGARSATTSKKAASKKSTGAGKATASKKVASKKTTGKRSSR